MFLTPSDKKDDTRDDTVAAHALLVCDARMLSKVNGHGPAQTEELQVAWRKIMDGQMALASFIGMRELMK